MKHSILKSIVSILAGFFVGAILSIGSDSILEKSGFMSMENFKLSPWWIVLFVIIYRFIFNVTGCYITARLAPNNPMKHVMIIGFVGFLLSLLGSIAMWEKALPWYNISIILISFPSAWIGGKIFLKINQNQ